MNYALVAGVIAAILFGIKYLMDSAKTDSIINKITPDAKAEAQYDEEVAQLQKEIENAKIAYSSAKRIDGQRPVSSNDKGSGPGHS